MTAGAKHQLVFIDRLLAALAHPRHGATHDVPACWFDADRSTITRAIGEVRPLLAQRGCTVTPDVRLRSLADVIEHVGANGPNRDRRWHQDPGPEARPRVHGPGGVHLRQERAERRQVHARARQPRSRPPAPHQRIMFGQRKPPNPPSRSDISPTSHRYLIATLADPGIYLKSHIV
ncbi:transposase family protein [Streptomyces sp. NPDC050516]|uniref:transposase family protein n=1 Tax=Streptomyces sp. NPDC050516 TaxID=3365621 RepID=UPI0037B7BD13